MHDLCTRDFDPVLIISDQQMWNVIGNFRNKYLSLHRWNHSQVFGDSIGPLSALGFNGSIVLLQEPVYGGDQANNLLFRYLHPAPDSI